jgi:hypothetical protein
MNHQLQHVKQKLNRLTNAKKAYNNAQRKANALKRQYHKAVFLTIYNQNQPHRNSLTQAEVAHVRNVVQHMKRLFMAKRVLNKSVLPTNMRNKIMNNVL